MEAAHNGDIVLAYEASGPPGGEPLLLISGTGAQMLIWPEGLCAALADRGFQVARFDNRDTGLSTHLTGAPAPGWLTAMLRPSAAPYRLADMADDALAVMDALGWPEAHVVGASLGGMIAQALAIGHPGRVRTLTSIMSTKFQGITRPGTRETRFSRVRLGRVPLKRRRRAPRRPTSTSVTQSCSPLPLDCQRKLTSLTRTTLRPWTSMI